MRTTCWLYTILLSFALYSIGWADSLSPAPPQRLRLVFENGNQAPTAADDSYSTWQATPLRVPAPGVLANDPDGDRLTAILVAAPTNGSLSLSSDGSFTYTPTADFTGSDSFTYKANDGIEDSSLATVSIAVVIREEGLVAHWSLDDGQGTVASNSRAHEHPLTLLPADNPPTWTTGFKRLGALGFDGTGQHAQATNVPVNQAIGGKNTIAFWMKFGTLGDPTQPVATSPIITINPAEGGLGDGPGLRFAYGRFGFTTGYNLYPDWDVLGVSHSGWAGHWKHVVAVFYNPDTTQERWEDVREAESKLYIDGVEQELTQIGTLRPDYTTVLPTVRLGRTLGGRNWDGIIDDIRIYNRELTPTEVEYLYNPWAYNNEYLRDASQPSYTVGAPGVLANDLWATGQTVTPVVVSQPEHGTVMLNADGSFTYTPDEDYVWEDKFTYRLTGDSDSNVATVTMFSDAPVVVNIGSYNTHLNSPVIYGAAGGVLHYATAREGSPNATAFPLTTNSEATAEVISDVSNGTLLFNANGSFTYTPNTDFTGADSFTYRAYDGESHYSKVATATITVSETPKEISELATWESQMLHYGTIYGNGFLVGSSNLNHVYYDAQRVYQNIADYTGDAAWLVISKAAGVVYLDYIESISYGVQGFWSFTHGLAEDYLRTGDDRPRGAVVALARTQWAADNLPLAWTENEAQSRETAYALINHITAEKVSHERFNERTEVLFNHALGHLDQWFIDDSGDVFAPFMFGLTAEALIYYWDYVDQDPRILEKLQLGADALFSWMTDDNGQIAWVPDAEAFWQRKNLTDPEPGLNLLIAPLYSWLYLQTSDATYRDRGDAIFAGAVKKAYLDYFKIYNQNYRWSFDYLKWRHQAEEKLAAARTQEGEK